MSVAELIADVLRRIAATDFYHGRPREFMRDQRALQRAIARYGYACAERGWEFSAEQIQRALVALLREIVNKQAPIEYFPIYLEGAVDRHIGQRAEELNALAKAGKSVSRLVAKTVGTQRVIVREQSTVEVLGALYLDLKRRPRKRKPPTARQKELL